MMSTGTGKQASKHESSVKEKFQRLFGISKSDVPTSAPKTREIVFNPEILKEIGPESPANNRLKTIRELCEVVRQKQLEDNAVEALCIRISDLLQPQAVTESRHLALQFLQYLLEGQLPNLSIMRAHFFRVIQSLTLASDLKYRLDLFATLSENGKNLWYFEEETGAFLLSWMQDVILEGHIASFLAIILNVIKYNAAYLDEDIMSGLVQKTCLIPNRPRTDDELKLTLQVLDAVIRYSFLPSDCLYHFIKALCHTVDKPVLCERTWELMRKLLGTYLGHSAIFTMCCMLQDKREPDVLLLRGAIFFTGMAIWGSRKVPTLTHTHSSVLPSFLQALSHQDSWVAYEVVLNLQRLVNKYGKELQYVTWEIALDILEQLLLQIDKCNFEKKVNTETHAVITSIEELYQNHQFFGPTARLFRIIEMCSNRRPTSSVCALMDYQVKSIHPGTEKWLEDLYRLMEKYYKLDERSQVRKKAMDVLSLVVSLNAHVYEKELIEKVVYPHFVSLDQEKDPTVRCKGVELLMNLCEDCNSNDFFDLIEILKNMIQKTLVGVPDGEKEDSSLSGDESNLMDIEKAISKMVQVFKMKLYTCPPSHSLKLYQLLISHLEHHYSHMYPGKTACLIRKNIFGLLVLLRADNQSRVGLTDRKPGERHVYSPYVLCNPSEELESQLKGSSSHSTSMYAVIDYNQTFNAFLQCLDREPDWNVVKVVLENLPVILENKTLVLSAQPKLDILCGKLCAMVKDRSAGMNQKLINRPKDFTRSDFHTYVFPILASIVTYHSILDRSRLRELVSCLEFGLVSKCAKICVTTLRICSLEMMDLMMRMLPSVLLSLSKISATISMAIPVLAFLSSIIRVPKLYTNFVEDQYMSVFAIALPYTNPFKFSHYAVSMAHHVIGIWFIRCRLPFRRGFVKYIQRGLKYNVLQLFEENTLSGQNENSSDRGRSGSLNEGKRRMRYMSGVEGVRNDGRFPMDEKMSQFHKELTETCVDMMSRYAFGNFTAQPKRSSIAEFVLKGGQQDMWVVGNKIVTITTSGGGVRSTDSALCDKCLAAYQNLQNRRASETCVKNTGERRRHKSLASVGRTMTQAEIPGSPLDMDEPLVRSQDDMSLLTEYRSEEDPEVFASGSPLSAGQYAIADHQIFSSTQCNCWLTGWAEVHIRGACGVVSWMMRIENESNFSVASDPNLPDITQLLAPVRCRTPDSESIGKIDSGSLCEEEYETLHIQHFFEAEKTLSRTSPQDVDSSKLQSGNAQAGGDGIEDVSPTSLRRISSSPSLSSSLQDCPSPLQQSLNKALNESSSKESTVADVECDMESSERSGAQDQGPKVIIMSADSQHTENISMKADKTQGHSSQHMQGGNITCKSPQDGNRVDKSDTKDISSATGVSKPHANIGNIPRSLSVSESKKMAPRSKYEDHQQTRPKALKLMSLHGPSIHETDPEEPDASEIQHKRRGHTISVMSSATDSKRGEEKNALKTSAGSKDGKGGLNPSYVFLQLYHFHPLIRSQEVPLHVPNQEQFRRTVDMLDHIYPYETHKIGVLYMGKGQKSEEKSLLANEYGSPRYIEFINGLGDMISIKEAEEKKMYLGGLNSEDGKFTVAWHDASLQVTFHIATLMRTMPGDTNCNHKKRHIGNDFVTIVYNDSTENYKSGTISGQFNLVSIVIRPLDHESNAVSLLTKEAGELKLQITSDIADILGHTHTKIISDANLPVLVRQIAVHCNLASMVLQRQQSTFGTPEVFASNWLERLRKIKLLKQRVQDHYKEEGKPMQASPSSSPWLPAGGSSDSRGQYCEDFTDYV